MYRLVNGFAVHVFRCRVVDGVSARPDSGEIAEVGWFAPDAIPSPMTNGLHHALPDARAGRRGVFRDGMRRVS